MTFLRNYIIYIIPLLFTCAATYQPPTISVPPTKYNAVGKLKDDIFTASLTTLAEEGYTITLADRQSGVISTDKKRVILTELDCDCGTTMGLPYIKDKRTITSVSINLTVLDEKFSLKIS
jgi:hypothetical protein